MQISGYIISGTARHKLPYVHGPALADLLTAAHCLHLYGQAIRRIKQKQMVCGLEVQARVPRAQRYGAGEDEEEEGVKQLYALCHHECGSVPY